MKKILFLHIVLIFTIYNSYAQNVSKASTNNCVGKIVDSIFESAVSIIDLCKDLSGLKIKSFTIFFQPKFDGGEAVILNTSDVFSQAAKEILKRGKPGDIYFFEDILIIMSDNTTRKIPDITFKIN